MTALLLLALLAVPPALADEQQRLAERFASLEIRLRQAADLLAPADPERAAALARAAAKARAALVGKRMADTAARLREDRAEGDSALATAIKEQQALLADLDGLLAALLRDEPNGESLRERIERRLKAIDDLARDQAELRDRLDRESDESAARLAARQGELAEEAARLAEPSPGADGDEQAAGAELEKAKQAMESARGRAASRRKSAARQDQNEALQRLRQAAERLRRLLKQAREEERLRSLAALEARVAGLLAAEKRIAEQTTALAALPAGRRTRVERQRAVEIGGRQRQVADDAEAALAVVREDNTSVAFDEGLAAARDEMLAAAVRLAREDAEAETRRFIASAVATLEELAEGLKQEIRDARQRQQQNQGDGGDGGGDDPLVGRLGELKYLRALQRRVAARTEELAKALAQDPRDADVGKELRRLAERQRRARDILAEIARKAKP